MAAQTADVFKALGSPEALSVVAVLLEQGEATVGDLAERTQLPQPTVSRYLKQLLQAGLITRERAHGPCTLASAGETRKLIEDAASLALRALQVRQDAERAFQRRVQKTRFRQPRGQVSK